MNCVTLVTGGARSGKSRYSLQLASPAKEKVFIATAELMDDEMRQRIEQHKAERGDNFFTIEEPLDLALAIRSIDPKTNIAVVDCLTVWLGNLMHHKSNNDDLYPEVEAFLDVIKAPPCDLIIVSNELGMGLVPNEKIGRRFRDLAGRLNQDVAQIANKVIFMVSGIPLIIKDQK